MWKWAALLGLAGLAAATGVIVWSGWELVLAALTQAGWGILLLAVFHMLPLAVSSEGWRLLAPGRNRPSFLSFVYFMWVRAAINNLMPVARIGGEIASVRLMTAQGMRRNTAIAITVAELTLSIAAVFVFVVLGVIGFALRVGDQSLAKQLAWGLVLSAPLLAAMAAVQKIGFFGLLSRVFRALFRDKWAGMAGDAARLDRAVATVYRRKGRALACAAMQFAAWALGAVEIWLALHLVGAPFALSDAAILEALVQGAASAAFAVPGALGVQEAGFLVFGGLLGLPPQDAAALAVMRRCRDLLCYAPGLVAWQAQEGKRLLKS